MKKNVKLAAFVLLALSFIYIGVGEFFYRTIFAIPTRNETINLEYQKQQGWIDVGFLDTANFYRIEVESEYGYLLDGFYFQNEDSVDKTIIVCHGVGGNKYGMFKVIPMFLDLGFHVLVYDTRAHGESGGDSYSFGFYEKYDVETIVNFVTENHPTRIVGVYGESMGAASILQHLEINKQNKNVDFYISDCAYSDLHDQFAYRLKQDYGVPDIGIVAMASLMTRFHEGYFFKEISPIRAVKKSDVPILFIHGKADDYVPFFMGEDLYHAKKNNKQFYWANGAKHVESFKKNMNLYEKSVSIFIEKHITK